MRPHGSWIWVRLTVAVVLLIWLATSPWAPTVPDASTLYDLDDVPLCAVSCSENADTMTGGTCPNPDIAPDVATCPEFAPAVDRSDIPSESPAAEHSDSEDRPAQERASPTPAHS